MVDKKKDSKSQIYSFYDISGDKVTRKKRDCPRCGKGVSWQSTKIGIPVANAVLPNLNKSQNNFKLVTN